MNESVRGGETRGVAIAGWTFIREATNGDSMSEHDHDYTLTVRPNATLRVAYSTDEGTLEKALVAFEYGHDGIEGMSDAGEGVVWRGYEVALSRNGENVLDRGRPFVESGDVERGLERGVGTATEYGRQLRERLGDLRERRSESSFGIADVDEAAGTPRTIEIQVRATPLSRSRCRGRRRRSTSTRTTPGAGAGG